MLSCFVACQDIVDLVFLTFFEDFKEIPGLIVLETDHRFTGAQCQELLDQFHDMGEGNARCTTNATLECFSIYPETIFDVINLSPVFPLISVGSMTTLVISYMWIVSGARGGHQEFFCKGALVFCAISHKATPLMIVFLYLVAGILLLEQTFI